MNEREPVDPLIEHHVQMPDGGDYLVRGLLFLSSYAILFGLLSVLLWPSIPGWICLALAGLGVGALLLFLFAAAGGSPDPYPVVTVRDEGRDVAGYVFGYLLPVLVRSTPAVASSASTRSFSS